jgi:hypothetical protein
MSGVKVRTQYAGNCFAAAASALVDAYRASRGETLDACNGAFSGDSRAEPSCNQTSDLWLAVALAAKSNEHDLGMHNYGRPACLAANAVLHDPDVGSCPRSAIPLSANPAPGVSKSATLWQIQHSFREYQEYRKTRQQALNAALEAEADPSRRQALRIANDNHLEERRERMADDLIACLVTHGVPSVRIPTSSIVANLFNQANPIRMVQRILEPSCRPPTRRTDFPAGANCSDDGANLGRLPVPEAASRLREMLNSRHDRPVMITYCAEALNSRRGDPGRVNRSTGQGNADCGLHASLVIGQRRDPTTGKCQFLVRNSWGPQCGRYAEGDWGGSNYCDPARGGNIWVDARELAGNVISSGRIAP